jgi:transposase
LRAAGRCSLDEILITYKFRIYPDVQQEKKLNETIETCRRLYNWCLADRKENGTGFYAQKRQLVALKRDDKYLKAVFSQVIRDRLFQCERCGLTLDRDVNAARNILKWGLERSLVETGPLLITRISKFQSRKQEAPEFILG